MSEIIQFSRKSYKSGANPMFNHIETTGEGTDLVTSLWLDGSVTYCNVAVNDVMYYASVFEDDIVRKWSRAVESNFLMYKNKTFRHTAKNGLSVQIACKIEYVEHALKGITLITVSGVGVEHINPSRSSVDKGCLFLYGCKYKGKKVSGIKHIAGLQEWWNMAKKSIADKEALMLKEQIEKDKTVKEIEFTIKTSNGAYSSNKYLQSLGFNELKKNELSLVEDVSTIITVNMGDYSITTKRKALLSDLVEAMLKVDEGRKGFTKKQKEKAIKELRKRIEEKNVPYTNMYEIDVDMSTGISYYTFVEKIVPANFNKVKKHFEFIESYENDFDPMHGAKFKGYATTSPKKVCDILYPMWVENELKELRSKLEELQANKDA